MSPPVFVRSEIKSCLNFYLLKAYVWELARRFLFIPLCFDFKGLLRHGSVLNYGRPTVGLDLGKKYDTELRTEFFEKYDRIRKCGIILSVSYTFSTTVMHATHFCFEVLHFSILHFLPITLPRQLHSPLQQPPPVTPLTSSTNNIVKKLNAVFTIRLFIHNSAYGEAFI